MHVAFSALCQQIESAILLKAAGSKGFLTDRGSAWLCPWTMRMGRGSQGRCLLVCFSAEASSPGEAPHTSADPHLLLTCRTVSVPVLQVCSVRGTQGGSLGSDEQRLF